MSNSTKTWIAWIVVMGIIVGGFAWYTISTSKGVYADGALDTFAACTAEKGAVMYGAYWCPHCKEQKALFEDAVDKISYVECTQEQKLCTEKGIKGYPTWIFADGSRQEGEITLQALAEKTSCELPAVAQ